LEFKHTEYHYLSLKYSIIESKKEYANLQAQNKKCKLQLGTRQTSNV